MIKDLQKKFLVFSEEIFLIRRLSRSSGLEEVGKKTGLPGKRWERDNTGQINSWPQIFPASLQLPLLQPLTTALAGQAVLHAGG